MCEATVNDAERVGVKAADEKGLGGGSQQHAIVRVAGNFPINEFDAARQFVFLEIAGGGEEIQFGRKMIAETFR